MLQKFKNKLNRDANLKELISGSAVTFVIKIAAMFINYVVILLISRHHGAEGVGIFGIVNSTITFFSLIGAMGMNVSILRYVGQFNHNHGYNKMRRLLVHATRISLPVSIILAIFIFISSDIIAQSLFENTEYLLGFKIAAVALPFFTINSLNVEFIRGLKHLKISEYLRSIHRFLVILIILGTSIFNFGVLNPIYGLTVGIIFTFLLSSGYILIFFFRKNILESKGNQLTGKRLFFTSTPMMVATVSNFLLNSMGLYFVEFYSTTQEVGIYNVSFKIAQLVGLILLVVNTISAPKFSEMYWNNKKEELKNYLKQASQIIFILSLIISLLIVSFSHFLLSFFGEEFASGQWVLFILILGNLTSAICGSVGIFMNMTGHQNYYTKITLIIVLFSIPLNFLLVKTLGMIGAAISSATSLAVLNLIAAYFVNKKVGFITYYNPFLHRKI